MPKKEPVRVLPGNAKPHEPFWRIKNTTEEEEAELEFYGFISEYSWFEDDITPKLFKAELEKLGGRPITIRINSGGGEVIAASVIRSAIVDYPGKVTVMIDGLAASAATIVATAGDVIKMAESAYFMIHDPSTVAWGTIDEIKKVLDMLKVIKSGLLDVYQTRTGLPLDKLSKLLSDETWLSAKEAKELGFVDEVVTPEKRVVQPAITPDMVSNFTNIPEALTNVLKKGQSTDPEPAGEAEISPEEKKLRAEVKLLI